MKTRLNPCELPEVETIDAMVTSDFHSIKARADDL